MPGGKQEKAKPIARGYPPPPAQVAVYADVIGPARTVDFLLAFGGAEMAIPKSPGKNSMLAHVVGIENARKLSANAHRLPKRVPLAKKWLTQSLAMQGLPVAQIARTLRTSDVSVRKWLKA
ncbi:MAG TPA: helix-turn-helix domain-containing protein [Rhodobacteraceae bacterium]|nr:helix-turn-helix domain-containing protein [Paracoccaceae bacterium]